MAEHKKHYIVGVHITDRVKHVPDVQDIFTKFGCFIKTRVGIHDTSDNACSPNGLVLIELLGDDGKFGEFTDALCKIEGVEVKHMVFDHI
ncbi:hypothetical protein QA601_03860 [Chitinispirillales bacterium ANBcel5]|uniref:hypothetical protein n=1 Tax=Cellulosispirillum alkaliphilum TaxID=3039283 RepID=UPI002A590CD3|nr:hypothetical protein [Chitinispirillales bacterium ANBcel5]